jgi:hypothetical protein
VLVVSCARDAKASEQQAAIKMRQNFVMIIPPDLENVDSLFLIKTPAKMKSCAVTPF